MKQRRQQGIALIMVLVIGLLLTTVMAALMRRSLIDAQIARNRDAIAQADALARGGIEIAKVLLIADAAAGGGEGPGGDGGNPSAGSSGGGSKKAGLDLAALGNIQLTTAGGATLQLSIQDPGSKLNLNSLVDFADPNAKIEDVAIEFLNDFLRKVIEDNIHISRQGLYEPRDLAHNLLDYVDRDDTRYSGGREDDYYQGQDPPYRAPNMPLLTVEEIGMIEGFDPELVDALRPYVTVHPMAGGGGINLNTAPAHVLAAVYHGNDGSRQLANEGEVRDILMARQEDKILCNEGAADDRCILLGDVGLGSIYPPAPQPAVSKVYLVKATVSVGEIRRSIEAVIDRYDLAAPQVLSWRVR